MSTPCAAAAPTRHPPGEAHAAPGALPLPVTTIAAALAMNRAGEHVAGGVSDADAAFHFHPPRPLHAPAGSQPPPTDSSDQACRPTTTRQGDAPTPTRPTSSAYCRQKRIWRHQATRDSDEGVGSLLPLAAFHANKLPSGKRLPTPSTSPHRLRLQIADGPGCPAPQRRPGRAAARAQPQKPNRRSLSPCRFTTTRQATPQLQTAQQLRPCVAKNASGDTQATHDSGYPRLAYSPTWAAQPQEAMLLAMSRHSRPSPSTTTRQL